MDEGDVLMAKVLTVEEILAAPDLNEIEVEVPEWGGTVKVREMTKAAQQRLRQQATVNGELDPDRLQILMLAECLAEPKITIEQAEQLWNKSAAAVDKVLYAIIDVNGLSDVVQKQMMKSFRSGV